MASDFAALFLSAAIAFILWADPVRAQHASLYLGLAPLVLIFLLGYAQAGLYPGFGLGPVETLRRFSLVTGFGFIILAALAFALKLPPVYSRVTFSLAFVLSLAFVPLIRSLVLRWASRWSWWPEPVVIVGTGRRAARVIRGLGRRKELGYRPAAVIAAEGDLLSGEVEGVPVAGGLEQAHDLVARGIRVALLEIDQVQNLGIIDRLHQEFRHVILLREYDDLPVEGLQVRNLGDMIGIEYTNNLLLPRNGWLKRGVDVVASSAALVVAAPVIVCAAFSVWMLDRGPAFFRQSRVGLAGQTISVPKIRTMRVDAEARLADHLAANPSLREEWEARYKLRHDPRVVPIVGRWLRRFSVDELPQFWSVLTGRMSLVGPRPLPDYHLRTFSPSFAELRRRVRPGITGLWQVTARGDAGAEEQEAHDAYYIRNWSIWLDIYLLSRTLAAVVTGRGAY